MKSVAILLVFILDLVFVKASDEQAVNERQGIGLGLDRGHSGTMVAEYLMGKEAANNPNGPGRRRRSPTIQDLFLRHLNGV